MKIITLVILLFLIATFPISGQTFILANYLERTKSDNDSLFSANFPYTEFVNLFDIDDFTMIEGIRRTLTNSKRNAEDLLFKSVQKYYEVNPIDTLNIVSISLNIQTGIFYFKINADTPDNSLLYSMIGRYILMKCIHIIERQIKGDKFNSKSKEIQLLYNKLEKIKLEFNIDETRFNKIVSHIKLGDWKYIYSRVKNKYIENKVFLTIILVIFFSFIFIRKYFRNQKVEKNEKQI